MAYELVYTSAPEGLSRGSSGFCVVACTKGLGPRLVLTLEGLSAYKPLYPHYAPNAWDNPISRTHYICEANGERQHILSRICFNGVDHTRRSNKLASHLVLSDRETAAAQGGPSSLLLHEELFKDASWVIKAEYFPKQKEIPATAVQVQKCMRWESVMGDAGWAGYLAQTYIDSPGKNVYIAYNPEQNKDILPLIHEAMQLLPDELRWKVTFNTYFVSLPAGMSCSWRCCPADSDAMRAAKRSPMNIVIDITKPQVLEKDGELITVARTGIIESPEEIPAAAESKENEISGNVPETDNLICLPKANLSQIGLQNKTGNLRVPQTGNRSDAVNRQQSDGCSAESRKPVWGMRKKTAAAIVLVLCMLSAGIGGFAFWFSAAKEKQIYLVQSGKYRDLRAEYDNVKSRCGEIRNKKSDVRTETQVNSLIADVKELKNKAETVKAAAEKLMVYQNLFEKRQMQEIASGVAADDTPRALIEMCETLQKDLERELSSLNIRLKEVKEQQEKKKVIQAPKKKAVPLPLLSEPVKASPKTAAPQGAAKKTEKKPVKTVQLFQADDSCYLWLKSASLHEMKMAGSVDIHTGAADPDKISIFLVPNTDRQEVGAELRCTDRYDRDVVIETKFNKDNGTLSFVQKEMLRLPDNREILVERDGKEWPLYFRLDISRIQVVSNNKDNLKIEVKDKLRISVNSSALRLPKTFYKADNSVCNPVPKLCLVCHSPEREFEIKKQGNQYVYDGEDVLVSRVDELAKIETAIKGKPESFAEGLKDKLKESLENELKNYYEAKAVVDDRQLRLEIEKLFTKEAKKAPEADVLREKVRKSPKQIQNENERMKSWVENYDKMPHIAESLAGKLKNIPLKEFSLKVKALQASDLELSWTDAKKKADKDLQTLESAIRKSSVVLFFGNQPYEQFSIEKILR